MTCGRAEGWNESRKERMLGVDLSRLHSLCSRSVLVLVVSQAEEAAPAPTLCFGAFLLLPCHSATLHTLHLLFFLTRPPPVTNNALPAAVRPHHQHTRRSQLEMAQQIVTPPEVALSHKPLRRRYASTLRYPQLPRRVSSNP
jgi:hypothetical protein